MKNHVYVVVGLGLLAVLSACAGPSTQAEVDPGAINKSNIPSASSFPVASVSAEPAETVEAEPTEAVTEESSATEQPVESIGPARADERVADIEALIIETMGGDYSSVTYSAFVQTLESYGVTVDQSVKPVIVKNDSSGAVVAGVQPEAMVDVTHDGLVYTFSGDVKLGMTTYQDRNERDKALTELQDALSQKLKNGEPMSHKMVWVLTLSEDGATGQLSASESTFDSTTP